MERMPKAWESHLSYFSNEFQVCDPRRSNRKCVCDVCVCEWGTQPLKRTQQWCWFIMRAWENVFSETFLSTSTNAWSWAFCLNQKCNKGGPNGFLLKLLEILCILCGIGSLWKILRTIMLPELSFRQNAWFLSWFSVTESQSHPPKWSFIIWKCRVFFVWIEQRLDSIYSKDVVWSYVWKGLKPGL